ncbi:MAG TPA: DUF4345 family protein [Candidatus Kapabacteria bacterium]|nr:DUF4345 family protein [Candidatus Kapabacteria bacterium]
MAKIKMTMSNKSPEPSPKHIDRLTNIGVWFTRAFLAGTSVLMTLISLRYISFPIESAKEMGIQLTNTNAITVARVAMGGFPLGVGLSVFSTLFSKKRMLGGIITMSIMITVLAAVRITGLVIDGESEFNLRVLKPELFIVVLSLIGLFFELRRQRTLASNEHEKPIASVTRAGSVL